MIQEAEKDFEKCVANNIRGNNKTFFKYVRSRKHSRKVVGLLDGER